MDVILSTDDHLWRLGVFVGALAAFMSWERLVPCRLRSAPVARRWLSNLGMSVLNRVLLRFLPLAAVSLWAQQQSFGVCNRLDSPLWLDVLACVLALDLVIYGQHRLFHSVPVLWRLHRMHHADTDFDVTTAVRFHPLEAVLSVAIKAVAVAALGAPVAAVGLFEVILSTTSLFNHANASLPAQVDRMMRWCLVTPDMHRVHHSARSDEMRRNFGFNLSWWDRLFGTYLAQPRQGHQGMDIGLDEFRDVNELKFLRMLLQPFR